MTNEQTIATWLSRLIQIPSVSPAQAGARAGTPGEAAIAQQLATWFQDLGADVHIDEVLPNRPNIYAIWRGGSEQWRAVEVHTDTVGVEQMMGDPFAGTIDNGAVHGRGAVDNKATLAILLALLEAWQAQGIAPTTNLLVAATVDEEVGTAGAPAAATWLQKEGIVIDQMIVAEPTLCQPIHGHKGVVRLAFTVRGTAAHSSQPHLGQNAIVGAAAIVHALQREQERLQQLPSTALGNPMLTTTLIEGGTGINVVPDRCTLSVDRRVVDGEDAATVATAVQQMAESATSLPVATTVLTEIDAFYQPPESQLVQQLGDWAGSAATVAPYGTNAWAYRDVVRACVVFGPGSIEQAHGREEWVSLAELERAATIYDKWLRESVG